MDGLALKLVLTPTLIGAVSMAGRRWGPGVSGWLVGFPFTSGPVVFFLALDHGLAFAAGAAVGSMTGAAAQAAFSVFYGRLARRGGALALLAGSLAFAAATVLLQLTTLTIVPSLVLVIGVLLAALVLMPPVAAAARPAAPPSWDIPARLVVTTAIVLLLTGVASALGPSLTGILATYPLYGAILAGFAHHLDGSGSAIRVLRGLLLGLFAFAGFFFVLASLIERAGIAQAFAAAIATALVLQGGALWVMRRESGAGPRPAAR